MTDAEQLSLSERLFTLLRLLQIAMLVMTLFYIGLGEVIHGSRIQPHSKNPAQLVTFLFAIALVEAAAVVYIRFNVLPKAEQALQLDSENKIVLMAIRKWYVISYALCLGIGFYGMVTRMLDAGFRKALVFYIAGFTLILFCTPRKPN
jgi:hypothetical protein